MDFSEFETLAASMYRSVPEQYRAGVEGISVERTTLAHPSLPEVYTLGECRTESYPSEFGGAGIVRSVVVLYYGSFVALSRSEEGWDWEAELWETITHELQHHLESLADDETLEALDYAEDQNFARREGEPYDPSFYLSGVPVGPRAWEVDGDVFVEVEYGAREIEAGSTLLHWDGVDHHIAVGADAGRAGPVRVAELQGGPGELFAVLLKRRGPREWLRTLLG